MDPTHASNSTQKVTRAQVASRFEFPPAPGPEDITRTLTLREAKAELGLTEYQVYTAVQRREIRCIQPGGKGRKWYLEDELMGLAERLARPHLHYVAGAA
jgi:hypothetical protein